MKTNKKSSLVLLRLLLEDAEDAAALLAHLRRLLRTVPLHRDTIRIHWIAVFDFEGRHHC